jgi:hypothetical protein
MTHAQLLALTWQVPAIFTAVPLVHRLLPFKLAARAMPLFYFLVSVLVMTLPGSVCLALGAAGLVSMLHSRVGVSLSTEPGPDMEAVANWIAVAWDYMVTHLPVLPTNKSKQVTIVDDDPEDGNTEYAEPPKPPERPIAQRIPHL